MKNIKTLFATPKKAILSSCCIVACLALLGTGTVFAAGAIAEKSSIGKIAAEGFERKAAVASSAQAQTERRELKNDELDYDAEFVVGGNRLTDSDDTVKSKKNKNLTAANRKITVRQAKAAALKDAGVSAADATFTKAALDTDDGVAVYDVEFYTLYAEYDYEIDALTGAVRSQDKETQNRRLDTTDATKKKCIAVDAAKSIALKHADISANNVFFTKAKLENDDGRFEYEIEFYCDNNEYEYAIDALTGEIIEYDIEAIDD